MIPELTIVSGKILRISNKVKFFFLYTKTPHRQFQNYLKNENLLQTQVKRIFIRCI